MARFICFAVVGSRTDDGPVHLLFTYGAAEVRHTMCVVERRSLTCIQACFWEWRETGKCGLTFVLCFVCISWIPSSGTAVEPPTLGKSSQSSIQALECKGE